MLRVSVIEGHALSLYKTRNTPSLPVSLKDSSSKIFMPGVPYVTCRMSLYDSFMKKLGTTSSTTQGTTSRDPCWTDQDFLLYVFPLLPLLL